MRNVLELQFSFFFFDLVDIFRIINVYQCLFNLHILSDEVNRGLKHEKKIVRHRLHLLRITETNDL